MQEDHEHDIPTLKEATAGLTQYSVESVVPFGPVHPALKEPEYFKLIIEGEKIVDVIPRIGYVHRGLEKAAEQRQWIQNIYMFERTCGICSFAHASTYVQAIEGLMMYKLPERAKYIRLIVAELERIHSHLLWVGLMGYWSGFETLFMWVWKDRETVLDIVEAIAGNRIHKSLATIEGVKRDIPEQQIPSYIDRLKYLASRAEFYKGIVNTEETLLVRTKGAGKISADKLVQLCAVGPLVRAAGLAIDVRNDDPYSAYGDVPFDIITKSGADIHTLMELRLEELTVSVNMTIYALQHLPPGPVKIRIPPIVPKGENASHSEAPRGEIFYYVKSSGGRLPDRVKVRTPTLANLPAALEMLKGQTLADVPVVLTGIDPCFGCMDRLSFADNDTNESWKWSGEQLRRYGILHYFPERSK
jgi:Ni,Fe-hydrogenase III large subunit